MTPISAGIAAILFAAPLSFVVSRQNPDLEEIISGYVSPGAINGNKANGFVAKFSDGRIAEFVQIQQLINGKVVAWKPDGTVVDHPKTYSTLEPSNENVTNQLVILRVKSPRKFEQRQISWSSLDMPTSYVGPPDDYMFTRMKSIEALPGPNGWQTVLVSVSQPSKMCRDDFQLTIDTDSAVRAGTITVHEDGSATSDTDLFQDVTYKTHVEFQPYPNAKGYGNGSVLSYVIVGPARLPRATEPRAFDSDGNAVKLKITNTIEVANGRKEDAFYRDVNNLRKFEMYTRTAQAVRFFHVQLKPKL